MSTGTGSMQSQPVCVCVCVCVLCEREDYFYSPCELNSRTNAHC